MKLTLPLIASMLSLSLFMYAEETTSPTLDAVVKSTSDSQTIIDKVKEEKKSDWKFSGIAAMNIGATTFTNWAEGGSNSANGVLSANLTLLYKKDRLAWETNFNTDFGITYMDNTKFDLRKTNDKIDFSTKFGYELKEHWYASVLGSFISQYTKGYEYATIDGIEEQKNVSDWLTPSYTNLSAGIDWQPNDIFSVYLSPVAGRITTSTDPSQRVRLGIPLDQSSLTQFGATMKGAVNYNKVKNLNIISSIALFTPYDKTFGNIDVDFNLAIQYQLTKLLNVSLSTNVKYYDSVLIDGAPRIQMKNILGIGLGYSF